MKLTGQGRVPEKRQYCVSFSSLGNSAPFLHAHTLAHTLRLSSHILYFSFFFFFAPFSLFILRVYSSFYHSRSSGCSTRDTFAIRSLRGIIRFG